MPTVSNRGNHMPSSPIRKLVPYADAAKKRGVNILHLNIGQPDINTPSAAIEAVKNFDVKVLSYIHSEGSLGYREKLAQYYRGIGATNIQPEDLIVTTGGSEALFFGLFSCLDPGDELILTEPFYANYNGFSIAGDIIIKPITASIENGFALPPMDEFEKQITEKTKAILICNPNNPTGYMYSKAELEALKNIALKHDIFLFADEVYREFVYDNEECTSILELEGLEQYAVVIDSVSKRYSACGARLGALVTRNKELRATVLKFAQSRLSPPTYSEILGEAALDTPSSYFEEVKQEYVNRRDVLVEGLNKIPGVHSAMPKGAFYTIAQLPVENADYFCQWILEHFEHQGHSVMMAPGSGFYSTPGKGLNEVRIAYVLNEDKIKMALTCLEKALEAYKKTASN